MKREPLMTPTYFDESISYLEKTISDRRAGLANLGQYKKPAVLARANFRDSCELLLSKYSKGDSVAAIAPGYGGVIDAWETYLRIDPKAAPDFEYLDDYVRSLWLISLALMFKVDDSLWSRTLACLGNEGRDRLIERLITTRTPGRKAAQQLTHAAIYGALDQAWTLPAEQRPNTIRTFLADWYGHMQEVGWHDCHKGPDGGGFFGYWAIEAAGVVTALSIDDSSFRTMPYYPADLVPRSA